MTSITLFHPIIVNGELKTTLDIDNSVAPESDVKEKSSADWFGREVAQLARWCKLSPRNIVEMDRRDYSKIRDHFTSFFV